MFPLPTVRNDDTTDAAGLLSSGFPADAHFWSGLHGDDGRPLNVRADRSGSSPEALLALERSDSAGRRARLLCARSVGTDAPPGLAGVEWLADGEAAGEGFSQSRIRFGFGADDEVRFLSPRHFHHDANGRRVYVERKSSLEIVSAPNGSASLGDSGGVSLHAPAAGRACDGCDSSSSGRDWRIACFEFGAVSDGE